MEDIAIVGIGCRFPGASGPQALWKLLLEGRSAISRVPADRWDISALYSPDPTNPGMMNSVYGAFLDQVTSFDAQFFGISPREARHLDPQQRLLLEVVWEAFQDGGFRVSELAGERTGVFVGIMGSDHTHFALSDLTGMNAHTGSGIGYCLAANRVSYQLNLGGPSMAIDTACSSSLVAAHIACQSLRSGETNMAVAAGVNIILSPALSVFYTKAGLLSPDGVCRTFDASANGIVRGEGVGAVVLKRLTDALADGDPVYAVIRGSAVNQDGRSNGLTAPNRWAQERVLRAAYTAACVDPTAVTYVELHGTGTLLGDPIEAKALASVLGSGRREPCAVGSIKTNMGHLEGAAGIAGLIKVALMLSHRHLVPSLNFTRLNPHIADAGLPLRVQTTASPPPERQEPMIAGVSSFGLGGTNAHMVLSESPMIRESSNHTSWREADINLLQLSAPSRQGLRGLAARYATIMSDAAPSDLRNICYTTNTARDVFSHRLAITIQDTAAAATALRSLSEGRLSPALRLSAEMSRKAPRLGFMYTGHGAHYVGMARELYQRAPVFRDALDDCDRILTRILPRPMLSVMFPTGSDDYSLDEARYSQPAVFAVEYALTKLLASWGIKPEVVVGHSVGEFSAACVAGAYGLEDSLLLLAERARLMSELAVQGAMMAVFAPADRVRPLIEELGGAVVIAAFNGPENTVISGEIEAVKKAQERLLAVGLRCVDLNVSMPFHSPLLEPLASEIERLALRVNAGPLHKLLISTLTGGPITERDLSEPSYWSRHACGPVHFEAGVRAMEQSGCNILVEIGPRASLSAMAMHCVDSSETEVIPTLRADGNDWQNLADCVARLYVLGVDVDWAAYESVIGGRKIRVPTYPFQRSIYSQNYPRLVPTNHQKQVSATDNDALGIQSTHTLVTERSDSVIDDVRQIVASVGQASLGSVQAGSRPYNDLGFDSLMLVEMKTAIEKRYPGVADVSLGRLFAGATVSDIARHVRSSIDTAVSTAISTDDTMTSSIVLARGLISTWAARTDRTTGTRIDRDLVHKTTLENVLLSRVELAAPDVIIAEVLQDTGHAFFYEHAKDHVPGLYLIEAARQFGIVLSHLYYEVPPDRPFIMDDLRVRFLRFAETTRPLFIIGEIRNKTYDNGVLMHMMSRATFLQDDSEICVVEGNFMITDPTWYAKKRNLDVQETKFDMQPA